MRSRVETSPSRSSGSVTIERTLCLGSSEPNGSWNTIWDLPPRGQLALGGKRKQIGALEPNAAGCRPLQRQDQPGQRRLAGAAFADDAEAFARRDGEAHAVERLDRRFLAEQALSRPFIVADEILDFEKRFAQ